MNAANPPALNLTDNSIENDERWEAVQRVLSSPDFVKAPRMRAMLSFLMLRKLSGMEDSISEHAMGIAVFRRDERDYDTTTDPVVRVQMGRLRVRLAQYYSIASNCVGLQIVIPQGSYVPELTAGRTGRQRPASTVQLAPLRVLTPDSGESNAFIAGLEEELALQLFQRFGGRHDLNLAQDYRIEISVRLEPCRARASIRLLGADTGDVISLQQCDCHGEPGITLQEELALAIFDGLDHVIHVPRETAQATASRLWT
jgi:hypothetical protein